MISFSEYMRRWLYDKEGYYAKFRTIGKEGDFYTAVSSSMFFGGAIAKRVISVIEEGFLPSNTVILEIGAHQGYLLADIVQFIYTLKPNLLKSVKFAIIEPFYENRIAQKRYFKDSFGDSIDLKIYKDLDEIKQQSAFIVANEIFDSFGCELIKDDKMLYKTHEGFVFEKMDDYTKEIAKRYDISKGEVSRGYEEFAQKMAKSFERYEFVSFDYGELQKRGDFSIRVYHKHKSIPFFTLTDFIKDETQKFKEINLNDLYQKSDITYDVHFNHLIDAFKISGAKLYGYKTQLAALVEFGIVELLEILREKSDPKSYKNELNRVKMLIDPAFMGERFKGVIFRKNDKI